jgi:sterol desaturase/sphingolipid hydroxylase (fatty acid hydroxylase superfamily)
MKQHHYQPRLKSNELVYCLVIFGQIFLTFLVIATAARQLTPLFFSLLFFDGFLAATYLEYHHHRFMSHKKAYDQDSFVFNRHRNHHVHPGDIRVTMQQRITMVLICCIVIMAALYLNNYFTLLAGFIFGASYSFLSHWMLHQPWVKKLFPRLLRFHIYHHSKSPNTCFGVSCPWWDILFDTVPPRELPLTNKIIDLYFTKDRMVEMEQNNQS